MGYELNEQPTMSAYIFYHDNGHCSSEEFIEKFVFILEKYGYFDITNVELGKHKLVDGILEDYVVRYGKKDMSALDLQAKIFSWANDDEIEYISFIHKKRHHWIWDITWFKNFTLPDGASISDYTFNSLQIGSAYEEFEVAGAQEAYIGMFCDLSDAFEAFYGTVEDVSTDVDALDRTKEKVFNPERIQTVHWGNYFGQRYCSDIGYKKLLSSPYCRIRETNKGVFVCLSDNILDSRDNPDYRMRKKIYKYLTK